MSTGYVPLFGSLATGTLCGKWPDIGLWPIVLSLSDRHGIVDVTPDYLARITGLPLDDVVACMGRFCAPDPYSRSTTESGARLVLLDPDHRAWGWRIVNHGPYRERARLQSKDSARTESGKDAERKREKRSISPSVPPSPPLSPGVPLSDSDSDSDKTKKEEVHTGARGTSPAVPRFPPKPGPVNAPRETSESEIFENVQGIKAKYPEGAGREDWITAEKHMRQLVINGDVTWVELEDGVVRYRLHCRATHRTVMNPANFFGAVDKPWSQKWLLPKSKAEIRLGSNLTAAEEFMRRTEAPQ